MQRLVSNIKIWLCGLLFDLSSFFVIFSPLRYRFVLTFEFNCSFWSFFCLSFKHLTLLSKVKPRHFCDVIFLCSLKKTQWQIIFCGIKLWEIIRSTQYFIETCSSHVYSWMTELRSKSGRNWSSRDQVYV